MYWESIVIERGDNGYILRIFWPTIVTDGVEHQSKNVEVYLSVPKLFARLRLFLIKL